MKKTHSILVAISLSALLVGCGDPTKEDTCGNCLDANVKAACELGYDACAETEGCSLGDYSTGIDDAGLCSEAE